MLELFPPNQIVGVFRGFREGGLEFHADLALPYQSHFHNIPMHGQFLLVQLENPNEAVLGRITSLTSDGRLAGSVGEDYNIRAVREERPISEELRKSYLKYRVAMRILGVVRVEGSAIQFVASHRRLPHVGSPVAFPSDRVLQHLVGHEGAGSVIGVFALGEFVYSGASPEIDTKPWMRVQAQTINVRFAAENLVSRRTFVFARAGFGKSNLNKLLFSRLYETTPTVTKRAGQQVPVGTIVFDPEGEYFWPDDKGRPALCDVPALADQLVVFTSRQAPSGYYGSFIAGGIKLDIRRLQPGDVISIALSPEKQDQQNVRKLRSMNPGAWGELVDLIDRHGNSADLGLIQQLLHLEPDQQSEALAARANMTAVVRMLHDRQSQMMDMLLEALSQGKLCIVDVSQLRGGASLVLSGLILRRIFDRNQEEFTKATSQTIPTIAVVEEAQTVLNEKASAAGPYIEWVKEGRKYDLGAMLITQQPGSIPTEILSQGDNWFIFHLLSATDLQNVRKANAHFSEDLLSSLLNEPLQGQGLFWSSVGGTPFPIPVRIASFESLYKPLDPGYIGLAKPVYASQLRNRFAVAVTPGTRPAAVVVASDDHARPASHSDGSSGSPETEDGVVDVLRTHQRNAIEALKENAELTRNLERGIPWGKVVGLLKDALPATMADRDTLAYNMVPEVVTEILGGAQDVAWMTERRGPKNTTFIMRKAKTN